MNVGSVMMIVERGIEAASNTVACSGSLIFLVGCKEMVVVSAVTVVYCVI